MSPGDDGCVISDEYGFFVASDGNDEEGDGTQAAPFASLTKALSAINGESPQHVYLCAGEYAEPGTLLIPNGVGIYGGFSCADGVWAYDSSLKSKLEPASPVGVIIQAAGLGVTLEDLEIDAQDAVDNGPGASSYGLIVDGSKDVVLTRVAIHAGSGAPGADGIDGKDPERASEDMPESPKALGLSSACSALPTKEMGGLPWADSACDALGGKGGIGYGSFERAGADGLPKGSANGGAAAKTSGPEHPGEDGADGADGADGKPGKQAGEVGAFSATGYVGASGGDGEPGAPGQGGGGGGASLGTTLGGAPCSGSGGGAGGNGGCGGQGGTGGQGGGASVAILSWDSTLTLNACVLSSASGGAGGVGGLGVDVRLKGGAGSIGGMTGNGGIIAKGGAGGHGGTGGRGASGAGGTGGPSIALVFHGAEPTVLGKSQLTPGPGGDGAVGDADRAAGLDGLSAESIAAE